ncbi:ribonuclease inhibitor-like isoform X2 [Astyanax mexicanus]|uniref:ribonuclease inhibitor-like isoform X2 n=1 Tax=Astyanax mexicanus TaxID=7994 RepID=UPI0020CB4F67|nr:ribonuclease inhibitor-like isoform X2 [Astyanax mexicanus]
MQYVWVILLFLPCALSQFTGKFEVVGPEAPVFSVSGSDVVLSCSVRELHSQNIMVNTVDMNVTWSRSDLRDSLVHLYGNHKNLNTDQNPSYRGRTAVFKEQLKNGNASLKLSNIRVSDEGEYTCRVDSKIWEDSKTFKLSVEAVGSEPVITMEKYESGKFSLLCESKGWRPEPELQWRNSKGVNLTAETETQAVADLFNVKSRITVEKIDSYYCSVTQRVHVKEGWIDAQSLFEHVPSEAGKIVGITIGVLLLVGVLPGVVFYICNERRKRQEEIRKVKSLLNSDGDDRLKHQDLSPRQWNYVEFTLLKSEEDLKEFNLRKFDPSDRGVQKLKKVIASSKKALLEDCNLSDYSCADLAKVLKSENSLEELNLSDNKLRDSGVEKLCDGLKDTKCKLKILRLEDCNVTEESCAVLADVLTSENSKLIELNLSLNKLQDSGVYSLCWRLNSDNCKLEKLRLEDCGLTENSCAFLAGFLKPVNCKLTELHLSKNKLQDSGVKNLCDGLKDKKSKLQILRLEKCDLTEGSCAGLASVLTSENSLIELNLSKNRLRDGVESLCDGLKDNNCKLQILRLEECGLNEGSCAGLASVLTSENSLIELNLSKNWLRDLGVERLCEGLKHNNCKLQILRLEECALTEGSCKHLATVLQSVNSKLIELNLSKNWPQYSGVNKLCDGLKDEKCKLEKLRLEECDLTGRSCKDLAEVLKSGNSKLKELHLSINPNVEDSGVEKLCVGLKNEHCKLEILRLAGCSIKNEGFADLASALKENPSSPLKELDLSGNEIKESELKLLPELRTKFPKLKVKLDKCRIKVESFTAPASENPSSPLKEQDPSGNELEESEQKLLPDDDTLV